MDYDFGIIGSGFGGSVAALRLAEKGYKVVVLEQGPEITAEDIEEGDADIRRLNWMPALGMSGYFSQDFFRHVTLVRGVGVGGGSHVYAAVLLIPKDAFYNDPAWAGLGIDWKTELASHYDTAAAMLGVTENPVKDIQDDYLKKTAEKMGATDTFGPTPNGIYFGTPETMAPDPFFWRHRPAPGRMPFVRPVPDRMPPWLQKHPGQKLSLSGPAAGGRGFALS